MILPKGYKKSFYAEKRYRPPQEQLARPMVDWNMLKIPAYEVDGIVNSLTNQADKKMKNIEVHP